MSNDACKLTLADREVRLDIPCAWCDKWGDDHCDKCNDTGYMPTFEGDVILRFIERHFKVPNTLTPFPEIEEPIEDCVIEETDIGIGDIIELEEIVTLSDDNKPTEPKQQFGGKWEETE